MGEMRSRTQDLSSEVRETEGWTLSRRMTKQPIPSPIIKDTTNNMELTSIFFLYMLAYSQNISKTIYHDNNKTIAVEPTFDVMREAHDRGLSYSTMRDKCRFYLGGTDAMTRRTDDIINTARDPVISIAVTTGSVGREIVTYIDSGWRSRNRRDRDWLARGMKAKSFISVWTMQL